MIKIKEYPDLIKDEKSNAILNTNKKALEEYKSKKLFYSTISDRINKLEQKVLELETEIKSIKEK